MQRWWILELSMTDQSSVAKFSSVYKTSISLHNDISSYIASSVIIFADLSAI